MKGKLRRENKGNMRLKEAILQFKTKEDKIRIRSAIKAKFLWQTQ